MPISGLVAQQVVFPWLRFPPGLALARFTLLFQKQPRVLQPLNADKGIHGESLWTVFCFALCTVNPDFGGTVCSPHVWGEGNK